MLFIGIKGRVDEVVVPREGIPYRTVAAGPLRVGSPVSFIANVGRLAVGTAQSLRLLRGFKPDAVFATGGYTSVPVGVATRVLRRPLVVYLPDVQPGWAVRLLARLATVMTTTSERALEHLPREKTVITGYPVRAAFSQASRDAARASFGIPKDAKVLLVTGASLGARNINEAIAADAARILEECHVLHVTGPSDEAWVRERRETLAEQLRERWIVRGYLDDMPLAMAAADLAVGRAGGSVLGELPAAGLPAIVVPGEYDGWSQEPNAAFLEERGAAVMLRNAELERLGDVVLELFSDGARLEGMRRAMRSLARPDAARDIARTLIDAAGGKKAA
jgi:UDP-N-acetylglucosamine--N-acetylmuramyl-(pentapeptide) pyrophosphoryl-undecaprenol N-acetylglucosamine transferase